MNCQGCEFTLKYAENESKKKCWMLVDETFDTSESGRKAVSMNPNNKVAIETAAKESKN